MRAVILLGLLASAAFATTQTVSQTSTADGRIHTRIEGIGIPSITAAPFTARVVVTWNQPLIGGGTVSRTYYTVVARDSRQRAAMEGCAPVRQHHEVRWPGLLERTPGVKARGGRKNG